MKTRRSAAFTPGAQRLCHLHSHFPAREGGSSFRAVPWPPGWAFAGLGEGDGHERWEKKGSHLSAEG